MPLSAGTKLGPYEILEPIGAGGMGEVWKARDTRLDRLGAIKFTQAQFSDRFEREARATAALNHPNVAQVYDASDNCIVMELVDGGPVAPPGDMRKLLDIAVQIADGLAAAPPGSSTVIRNRKISPCQRGTGQDSRFWPRQTRPCRGRSGNDPNHGH
jgi:serine/threonine protein kinase